MFCEPIGVGLCMRLETHLTHELGWFEHFNDPDTALSYLASLHCASCVVDCSISMLYNECVRD